MNNPYIVHIALHAKFASHRPAVNTKRPKIKNQILEIGEKDKHGNTLYYMVTDSLDKHYKICVDLALKVWKKRFGVSKNVFSRVSKTISNNCALQDEHRLEYSTLGSCSRQIFRK